MNIEKAIQDFPDAIRVAKREDISDLLWWGRDATDLHFDVNVEYTKIPFDSINTRKDLKLVKEALGESTEITKLERMALFISVKHAFFVL